MRCILGHGELVPAFRNGARETPAVDRRARYSTTGSFAVPDRLGGREIMSSPDRIAPSTPAQRMRLYRRRRRQDFNTVRIELHATEIDTLVRMRLLTQEQRQDHQALQTAILGIVYGALEDAS